jgi:hypothetical protein
VPFLQGSVYRIELHSIKDYERRNAVSRNNERK